MGRQDGRNGLVSSASELNSRAAHQRRERLAERSRDSCQRSDVARRVPVTRVQPTAPEERQMNHVIGGMLASALAIYVVGCAVDEPKNLPSDTGTGAPWQQDGNANNASDPSTPDLRSAEDIAASQGVAPLAATFSFARTCI